MHRRKAGEGIKNGYEFRLERGIREKCRVSRGLKGMKEQVKKNLREN